jgi:phage host-nuclease inhibitor protein Gam
MKRLKVPPPRTREGADALLFEIGSQLRSLEAIDRELEAKVAAAHERAKERATPIADVLNANFKALADWARASKDTLLVDGKRTHQLASGWVGWRATPPKVEIDKDHEAAVIATLRKRQLDALLRIETSIDKQAVLRAPGLVEGIAGLAITTSELFWAQPRDASAEMQLAGGRARRAPLATKETT